MGQRHPQTMKTMKVNHFFEGSQSVIKTSGIFLDVLISSHWSYFQKDLDPPPLPPPLLDGFKEAGVDRIELNVFDLGPRSTPIYKYVWSSLKATLTDWQLISEIVKNYCHWTGFSFSYIIVYLSYESGFKFWGWNCPFRFLFANS